MSVSKRYAPGKDTFNIFSLKQHFLYFRNCTMNLSFLSKVLLAILICVSFAGSSSPENNPPIEAYGERPEVDHVALSASGTKVAIVVRSTEPMTATVNREGYIPPRFRRAFKVLDWDGLTYYPTKFVLHDLAAGTTQSVVYDDYGDITGIDFVGEDYVLVTQRGGTEVVNRSGHTVGARHWRQSMIWDLKDNQIRQFAFKDDLDDAPADRRRFIVTGLVATSNPNNQVYVQAFAPEKSFSRPRNHLLKADLETGGVSLVHRGDEDTIDWVVQSDGQLLARVDYDNRYNSFKIVSEQDGSKTTLYKSNNAKRPPFSLIGVHPESDSLIILASDGFDYLAELKTDGTIWGPMVQQDGKDIDLVFVDDARVVQGVKYSGVYPSYQFLDEELDADIRTLISEIPGASVTIVDHSSDWQKLLLKLEGSFTSGMYVLYDRASDTREMIAETRPDIPPQAIGEALAFQYPARDGLMIEAIVTLPPKTDLAQVSALKTIVMPHGGPEAHDAIGFDWMAQYFSNRGYLVLQPNFRGSSGYGDAFVAAGNGEWGGKMQDDLTDGLQALVDAGLADPDKVCIVGASYGGYAALAGGAFTPELYKCVVAIAPVSDLRLMLREERRDRGRSHWVIDYWEERMSDGEPRTRKLNAISPRRHAANFQAPVLLIHGDQDSVVPIEQSEIMQDALVEAGKTVEFILLEEADHWLSESASRLVTLQAASSFVERQIGD